ncbi:predicted protein [Plenodomus lingam JN3]|uniref:Predicted protein n=1 Tax=Leptosphaeria maculans (strain JN3 / isolate v23.1.3 / race Av1-4-5-6-7-8) TaxID=985895 RepID=E5A3D1_LEPMJ|nr:predicted protein [Plenodomus lingam JN3]CBX98144.1 predicted protein [Plenodomus lingam JN3]
MYIHAANILDVTIISGSPYSFILDLSSDCRQIISYISHNSVCSQSFQPRVEHEHGPISHQLSSHENMRADGIYLLI